MKWSVSNIEIDLTAICAEAWTGWSAPSTGSVNLFGDPQYDLIDDGSSGTITESIESVNPDQTAMFPDNMCSGDLTIISVTGLNGAMASLRAARDEEFAEGIGSLDYIHEGQISANVANNIGILVTLISEYNFGGFDPDPIWTPGERATVEIYYGGTFGGASRIVLQNESAGVVTVTDPGLVWRQRSPAGVSTYSHPPDETGVSYPGFGSAYAFHADGTQAISCLPLPCHVATSYPFHTADFFATAGQFQGDWTVAEALALL